VDPTAATAVTLPGGVAVAEEDEDGVGDQKANQTVCLMILFSPAGRRHICALSQMGFLYFILGFYNTAHGFVVYFPP
jgi:hypothetical protein